MNKKTSEEASEKGLKKGWDHAKHLGKDVKDSKPRDAIETGAKKGWGAVKNFGKKGKGTVPEDEEEKQE